MKIISWNCNMAFRKKAEYILTECPDILIVPECECPEKLKFPKHVPTPSYSFWYGENPNKGIGVFSYNNYQFKLLDDHDPNLKYVLPLLVTGGDIDFILFAIWANNPADEDGHYITQIWKAIKHYGDLLTHPRVILMGDFNSNTIWDKLYKEGNHSEVVCLLALKGITSVYHKFFDVQPGKETHPTLYMYRHESKPYHIDYCFASLYFTKKLQHVEVGTYADWTHWSDHKPVIVTFNL